MKQSQVSQTLLSGGVNAACCLPERLCEKHMRQRLRGDCCSAIVNGPTFNNAP
jgi:hypothetical protein